MNQIPHGDLFTLAVSALKRKADREGFSYSQPNRHDSITLRTPPGDTDRVEYTILASGSEVMAVYRRINGGKISRIVNPSADVLARAGFTTNQ
jgi:hypothetical protein